MSTVSSFYCDFHEWIADRAEARKFLAEGVHHGVE